MLNVEVIRGVDASCSDAFDPQDTGKGGLMANVDPWEVYAIAGSATGSVTSSYFVLDLPTFDNGRNYASESTSRSRRARQIRNLFLEG